MEVTGICTNVSKYSSGTNSKGDWSIQYITLKGEKEQHKVAVWNRPDLSSAKGRIVTVSGCEPGEDQKGQKILELKGGEGKVEAREPAKRTSQAGAQAGKYERPTQEEYEKILGRAIGAVAHAFKAVIGSAELDQAAVAHVVNGYMVGYSKGDFVLKATEAPKAPPSDDDIPF